MYKNVYYITSVFDIWHEGSKGVFFNQYLNRISVFSTHQLYLKTVHTKIQTSVKMYLPHDTLYLYLLYFVNYLPKIIVMGEYYKILKLSSRQQNKFQIL